MALTFKDGKVHTIQRAQQTVKGTRYFDIISSPLKDSTGEIIAAVKVLKDITERKHFEEALRESDKRFKDIFDNASDGILLADPDSMLPVFKNPCSGSIIYHYFQVLM